MTRNWKWLALAVLTAAGGPAAAQECSSGACNAHSREPAQVIWSTQESPRCGQTLWECLFPTAGEGTTSGTRAFINLPGIHATADHLRLAPGSAHAVLLEGNVELLITKDNHPARIVTGRAVVNLADDTYEVLPCHFEDTTWTGRAKPMSYVVPTPAERGWR